MSQRDLVFGLPDAGVSGPGFAEIVPLDVENQERASRKSLVNIA